VTAALFLVAYAVIAVGLGVLIGRAIKAADECEQPVPLPAPADESGDLYVPRSWVA